MTFFRISLKSCTHAHTKHNIGPRCTKVRRDPIMEWYNFWSMSFPPWSRSRCPLVGIGVLMGLALSMSNFFNMSLVYLVWLMNMPSFSCLIWNLWKNFNSPIMDISNLFIMILLNSSQKVWLVLPNIMSSTYIWHTNISLPTLWVKRVGSALPISKPYLSKNSLRHSYHALGACLRP